MPYLRSTRGEVFKLELVCMNFLMADGKLRRGVVLGVQDFPNDPFHLRTVVLFEGGAAVPKVIRRADFLKAQKNNDHVTFMECPDLNARGVLVGPNGHVIETLQRGDSIGNQAGLVK